MARIKKDLAQKYEIPVLALRGLNKSLRESLKRFNSNPFDLSALFLEPRRLARKGMKLRVRRQNSGLFRETREQSHDEFVSVRSERDVFGILQP